MAKIQALEVESQSAFHSPSAEEQVEGTWFPTDVLFTS